MFVHAVSAQHLTQGKILGMGGGGAALDGLVSINVNPAGLTRLRHVETAVYYQRHFLPTQVASQGLLVALPLPSLVIGTKIAHYGVFGRYNDLNTSLSFAKTICKAWHFALSANYHQLGIKQVGMSRRFSLDFGAQFQPDAQWTYGLYLQNMFSMIEDQAVVPMVLGSGVAYAIEEYLLLTADIKSYLSARWLDGSIGLSYQFHPVFTLRGGLSFHPFMQYMGFSYQIKKIEFSVNSSVHTDLGYSPQMLARFVF